MKAKVHVFLKPGVLDVQGKAIEGALHTLGFADVEGVRVGKTIEMDLAATDPAEAQPVQGALDGLALDVQHARLEEHFDLGFHPTNLKN